MLQVDRLTTRGWGFGLHDVSFAIATGSYGVVVGPAGAGKTTLLETIAGLRRVRAGTVRIADSDVTAWPPEARCVGLVYQHAFLFPHLSVVGNVAYAAHSPEVVRELMERFELGPLADRDPASLSGGERQLVALARAFASRPRLLLLDEPFGALDPRRRTRIRGTVRALHDAWNLTTLHVTHDFAEAGVVGERMVVLDGGRVQQVGAPEELFRRPASPRLAEFLGAENVLAGVVQPVRSGDGDGLLTVRLGPVEVHAVGDRAPGAVHVVIRAEDVLLERDAAGVPAPSSARNVLRGRVLACERSGWIARVTVDVNGVPLVAAITASAAAELALAPGVPVIARLKATAVHVC